MQEDKVVLRKVGGSKQSSLANKVKVNVCGHSAFVDVMKTIVNLVITFQKHCMELFPAKGSMGNVKDMMGSDSLASMSFQF